MTDREEKILCFLTRVKNGEIAALPGREFQIKTDHGSVRVEFYGDTVHMNWYDPTINTWTTFNGSLGRAAERLCGLNPDAKTIRP